VEKGAEDVYPVKPIENLWQGRERLLELAAKAEVRVGVVGGGPGALEVAGNAWAAAQENNGKGARVRIYGGKSFLRKLPQGVQKRARKILNQRGIEIIEGQYAEKVEFHKVTLPESRIYEEDIIFTALGVRPRPLFAPSGLSTGKDGGLLVNRFLQNPEHPEIFGGGDCIWFEEHPLDKVGVYAVRQNPVILHNVQAACTGEELMPFDPGGDYLLIFNLGQGKGILHKKGFIMDGSLAFWIKDYIDSKFIKKFKPVN
jgi:NADH dehydrogenase FAD-containing subunit